MNCERVTIFIFFLLLLLFRGSNQKNVLREASTVERERIDSEHGGVITKTIHQENTY